MGGSWSPSEPAVGRRGQPPVLRPLDLGGQVGERPEAEGAGQRPRDREEHGRLRREHLAELLAAEVAELGERGRVEGARGDARGAEAGEALAHLRRRLVGEGHGEDLAGGERAGGDLVRDAVRDRRRLARARARENADGAAHGLDRAPLLGVEPREDVLRHGARLAGAQEGICAGSVKRRKHGDRSHRSADRHSRRDGRRLRGPRPGGDQHRRLLRLSGRHCGPAPSARRGRGGRPSRVERRRLRGRAGPHRDRPRAGGRARLGRRRAAPHRRCRREPGARLHRRGHPPRARRGRPRGRPLGPRRSWAARCGVLGCPNSALFAPCVLASHSPGRRAAKRHSDSSSRRRSRRRRPRGWRGRGRRSRPPARGG